MVRPFLVATKRVLRLASIPGTAGHN